MPYMSKDEQATEILNALGIYKHWWTRLKLARKLGYESARSIESTLKRLQKEGYIERRAIERPQGGERHEFRITPEGYDAWAMLSDGWQA